MSATLPPDARLRLEEICDRFELALRRGQPGRIEDFLAEASGPERGPLLYELLALEAGYHRATTPSADAYRRRFPELGEEWLAGFCVGLSAQRPGETVHPSGATSIAPPRATAAPAAAGTFGDYDLLAPLGEGGMGVVYKARQRSADRVVALKMIRPGLVASADGTSIRERFAAEARAAARLEHDHVVTVYDVGTIDGVPYYAMRLVAGRSLAEVIKAGPVAGRQAAAWLEPVARAVHHAHERGLLHRDLKPGNVLLDEAGRPYVTDFGLVKWAGEGPHLTRTGQFLGTPSYASPEQADAVEVTAASDVYGLGATLYALLTGRPPFQAASVAETLHQVKYHDPVAPRALNPATDADLEVIALACLHKEPGRRYASARALADDLTRYLHGEPIRARPITRRHRAWRWCRRNPYLAAASAVAGLALLATVAVSLAFAGYFRRANAELGQANEELGRSNAELVEQRDRAARLHGRSVTLAQTFTASLASKRVPGLGKRISEPELARTAAKLWKEILADDPRSEVARSELANVLYYQGAIARDARKPAEQRAYWHEAVEVSEALVRDAPGRLEYSANLGASYYNFAVLANKEQRPAEMRQWLDKAIGVLGPLRQKHPTDERVRWFLMSSYSGRAGLALDARDYQAALPDLERAEPLARPEEVGSLRLHGLALALAGVGRHEEALRLVEGELSRGRPTREDQAAAAEVCAVAAAAAPAAVRERYARRAMGLLQQARARGMYATAKEADELRDSPSFAALRGRRDFADFVAAVRDK